LVCKHLYQLPTILSLVLCSTSASAFGQIEGDVNFSLGGPSGGALEKACQSDKTPYMVCDYVLKGFIDGIMFREDKDVCKRQSFDDGFKWAICLENYDTGFADGELTVSMYYKVCLPDNMTFASEKLVVMKYLAYHQKRLFMPAVYLTYLALSQAFPCPKASY